MPGRAVTVPAGKKIILREKVNGVYRNIVPNDINLIIEEDITLSLSSTFDDVVGNTDSNLFNLLGNLSKGIFGDNASFSGQFKQLGMQLWKKSAPISFKVSLGFYLGMAGKYNAKYEVYDPTMALIKLPLPSEGGALGSLIPPGPSILTAFDIENQILEGSVISCQIARILYLSNVIIESVQPTFSNETDVDGYPVWSKVELDIKSVMNATKQMIDQRFEG